ncbi:MAG: GTP-binding protein [Candidatus Thorarchaeota archaeon]
MLRQVLIFKDSNLLYERTYSINLDSQVFNNLLDGMFSKAVEQIYHIDSEQFRFSFVIEKDFEILFLFVHDKKDDFILIKKELTNCKEKFLESFKDIIDQIIDSSNLTIFNAIVDSIQNKFPPIISIVGYEGVGKTTITNLIRSKEISTIPDPQISGNIARLKIGSLNFIIREFVGEKDVEFLWNNFVRGSDLIILVTNSTLSNVEDSRFFLKIIEEELPYTLVFILGNKQDLEGTLKPQQIEDILEIKTYGLIAEDPTNRGKLIEIIMDMLQIQEIIIPLLNMSNERESLINEMDMAITQSDFERADFLYKKIIKICLDLGDNPLNMEFYKNYEDIQDKLKKIGFKQELGASLLKKQDQQLRSISSLEGQLKTLLNNYIRSLEGILTVIISDKEGFVITSESREDTSDESLLGAIAVMMDSYLERIRREFGNETTFFNITTIQEKKFAYGSMGPRALLLTVSDLSTNDTELRIYTEYIAGKVELLLEGNDNVSLEIPEIISLLSKTRSGTFPTGDYSFKLILLGDFAVGKTSLITRFVQNLFKEDYHSTVGVNISQKIVKLDENTKVKFIIWDVGGQMPKMAPYRKKFYEGVNSALIVIDRTRPFSLKNVDKWYNEIKSFIKKEINIILVANKSDLTDKILVSEDDIKSVANKYRFNYIITSAKTGESVNETFLYIAYRFLASLF